MGERKGTKGLELWCKKMTQGYPGVKIDNMTTSWRDGLAFCAMIHHFRPDLIEFDKLNKDDIYHNNELAFRIAEHHLGIPALLEPEDMVEYEVPDRLSILTYLSQFYQTFENQRGKSGARIAPKRPQSSPDHGIVSPASTSPPTKVQITVGRAKREPCAKCGLPVFIAERLNVGKLLYHRTCFRCARCNSQLTLANYYETENSEFCCEICPDEEKIISKKLSSEHSVLLRSMSDEEKSASLKTYSEAPDAYSTHFETALEFPVDGELKKNFTLTDSESAEFSKARSHFFKSQIEDSTDTDSDGVPPDLPQSKPPPLTKNISGNVKTDSELLSSGSSFPSDKKDTKNVSDSVSEQTNDHFVTKDNVSSNSGISVKARMKLFENNKDKKSDVNISSNKQVPFKSTKKTATVVAIDDLEDFENISKKEIDIEHTPLDRGNNNNTHSNIVRDEGTIKSLTVEEKIDKPKDPNIVLSRSNNYASNLEFIIKNNNLEGAAQNKFDAVPDEEKQNNDQSVESGDSIVEIIESSQEQELSHISINSHIEESNPMEVTDDQEKSHITIEDSPVAPSIDTEPSVLTISDSFVSAGNIISPQTNSSFGSTVAKRGYYTAYEILSPTENSSANNSLLDTVTKESTVKEDDKIEDSTHDTHILENREISPSNGEHISPQKDIASVENITSVEEGLTKSDEIEILPLDKNVPSEENIPETSETPYQINDEVVLRRDETAISIQSKKEVIEKEIDNSSSNKDQLNTNEEAEPDYPETLNPFGDEIEEKTSAVSTSLNPFGDSDDDKEEVISPVPVPAARPKKKIIPSLEEREIKGTPECLAKIYIARISRNPFEEDDEEEEKLPKASMKPMPSPRQKRKISIPHNISLNPFGSDDEEMIVPVPTPRISKSSPARPEPRPRDTLSITSRGSHGGSNSSISSGSAVGSARKKKPAPRPPLPFRNSEPVGSGSLTSSPSQSVVHSPYLSGTIRSRKSKRAPLPPNASTPASDKKEVHDRLSSSEISPISLEHAENSPNKSSEDQIQREKNVKDEENRNRQSQNVVESPSSIECDSNVPLLSKSASGRWKRRKGPAPTRPIPQRRITKTLPMSEIKRELETIEIQQQGLEKQGVRLEQIIREKCEGDEGTNPEDQVPIEVEDLILQLFELVNEKNELFRRQAELMYLRRQQRLEEEHADVEYQIRCLMLQPEANKTDSDKAREEALINRLVEIVERRNEIIECLEMDRVREAEEDNSISSQLNLYSLKRDGEKDSPKEDGKKEKKKKHKKLSKIIHTLHKHKEKEKEKDHKVDIDKDVDETEVNSSAEKKKKKKFNIF